MNGLIIWYPNCEKDKAGSSGQKAGKSKNPANFVIQKNSEFQRQPKIMSDKIRKGILLFFLSTLVMLNWQCMKSTRPGIPADVLQVIQRAGLNKPELVKAIGRYVKDKDSLKRKALFCLMAQMDRNYTVDYSVQDTLGNHYSFSPKDYSDYLSLKHAWDSTEQVSGNLLYHADSFRVDGQTLSGNYLINNLNEAFKARSNFPWSKDYNFQTFCHWILPYRVWPMSNRKFFGNIF